MGQTNKCALIIADGKEKEFLPGRFESRDLKSTFLQYVLDSVWTVADEILVIFGREPSLALIESIAPFGVKVAIDRNGATILSRVIAGFKASSSENCLVILTSSPFVKPNVIFQLFEEVRSFDAAVPRWSDGKLEPLLAVYRKKPFLKAATAMKGKELSDLVGDLYAVSFVEIEQKLKPLDPELLSFFNVRNARDLERARSIASAEVLT